MLAIGMGAAQGTPRHAGTRRSRDGHATDAGSAGPQGRSAQAQRRRRGAQHTSGSRHEVQRVPRIKPVGQGGGERVCLCACDPGRTTPRQKASPPTQARAASSACTHCVAAAHVHMTCTCLRVRACANAHATCRSAQDGMSMHCRRSPPPHQDQPETNMTCLPAIMAMPARLPSSHDAREHARLQHVPAHRL